MAGKDVELEDQSGDGGVKADTRPRLVQLCVRRRKMVVCLAASLIVLIIIIVLGANYGKTVEKIVRFQYCYQEHVQALTACSNNGHLYPESPEEGCVCFGCFYDKDCSKFNETCQIDADGPQTFLFQQYWLANRDQFPPLSTSIDYRVPYQGALDDDDDLADVYRSLAGPHFERQNETAPGLAASLDNLIRAIHRKFQNAKIDGRFLVFGNGVTQLQNAAIWAFARIREMDSGTFVSPFLYSAAPYDPTLPDKCLLTRSCSWTRNASLQVSDLVVEVITKPGTPDGSNRRLVYPTTADTSFADLSGYWRHLATESLRITPQDFPVMLFSWSRLTGHAASRFGWAVVQNRRLADVMAEYVRRASIDVSVDVGHRVLSIGNALLANGDAFFNYTDETITKRWDRVIEVLKGSDVLETAGARNTGWLWLRYKGEATQFKQGDLNALIEGPPPTGAGISGTPGDKFGMTDAESKPFYAINMLLHDRAFDLMLKRLCQVAKEGDTACLKV